MAAQQIEKISVIPQDEPRALAVVTPMDMIQKALDSSASMEVLEKMMGLQERWEANNARKAFDNALADAKGEIPIIVKNRLVDFKTDKGRTTYKHEDLAEVVATVAPILSKHGIFHRWRLSGKPGELVTVTCIISHRDGYFEENSLSAGADTSGGKNAIQGVKSAVSYLERITLTASLGLASKDDDDGRATASKQEDVPPPPGSISQEQVDNIRDLLEAKGASVAAFLNWAKLKRIEEMPIGRFDECVAGINGFRKS